MKLHISLINMKFLEEIKSRVKTEAEKLSIISEKVGNSMSRKIDINKFKDVVGQLKTAQKQLQSLVNKETIHEAKKYAEASSKELKKFIQETDINKVKTIITKEAKEIQKLQKQIPAELAKFSKFVDGRRKELEGILKNVNALEVADTIQKTVRKKVESKLGMKTASVKKKSKKTEAPSPAQESPVESKPAEAQVESSPTEKVPGA